MKSKGFTLLEVIAAIFILVVGIGGSFSLIYQTLSAASIVEMELTASYLAQEGIEIVKNLRDRAWLERRSPEPPSWNGYLPDGDWEADYSSLKLENPYAGTFLNIDSDGFYSYSAGNTTKFKRKISIDEIASTTIEILIEVEWQERGRSHEVKVLEHITDWL